MRFDPDLSKRLDHAILMCERTHGWRHWYWRFIKRWLEGVIC
jgi:hypothetical protein